MFRYNLRLERNEQLLRGGNKVRVWVADSPSSDGAGANRTGSTHFGGITLEELPQVGSRVKRKLDGNLVNKIEIEETSYVFGNGEIHVPCWIQ